MGSKGSNTTTQSYTPNQTVGQSGTTALTMAQAAAGQPFQQPVAPVAGFTDDQLSAFANMRAHQGYAEPYFQRGAQLFNQSASPISAGQVGNYLNPFADYVMGGLRDVFGQQMRDTTGRLTQAAGGVGADRIGVAQANLAKQQGLAAGQTLAGIYQPALGAAQQDAARQQAAAFGFAQMGPAAQGAAMAGTQGLFNFGGLQQQQQQAELNAPYQLELARLAYPFQTAQYLSGVTAGTAPALGGTTTNTYPKPSPWGTIAGLGMTAAGAAMGNPMMMAGGMGSLKGSQTAPQSMGMMAGGYGMGGWNPNVSGGYVYPGYMAARGGAINPDPFGMVQGYQDGGDIIFGPGAQPPEVPPGISQALETGAPIPEEFSVLPPPAPPTPVPTAMNYAPIPPAQTQTIQQQPPMALPQLQPYQPVPFDIPPDLGEGTFARSPGLALMNAGLATMAAAGRRDSRGLPLPPFAAIGEGGMQGVKMLEQQEQQGLQRRRVDLEARRLMLAADATRRAAELHPYQIQHQQIQNQTQVAAENRARAREPETLRSLQLGNITTENREVREQEAESRRAILFPEQFSHAQLENIRLRNTEARTAELHPLSMALQGLSVKEREIKLDQMKLALKHQTASDEALSDPAVLKDLGLTPQQAAILTPDGVRAYALDLAKTRYDYKVVGNQLWATDRVDPSKTHIIGNQDILAGYGIRPPAAATTSPAPAAASPPAPGAPAAAPPPPGVPRPGIRAPAPAPALPGAPRPAGARTTPEMTGSAGQAFGAPGLFNWANMKVQGVTQNSATPSAQDQAMAQTHIELLRERLISALSEGDSNRLAIVQKRIQSMFPSPGSLFTPAPQAFAFFTEVDHQLSDRIAANSRILQAPLIGNAAKDRIARITVEQQRIQEEIRTVIGDMSGYDYLGNDRWRPRRGRQ